MTTDQVLVLDPSEISSLTDTQEKIISLLAVIASLLSVSCSSVIIYLVYKAKFDTPYRRILFGLSVSDVIASITFALQPFLLPAKTSQRIWAIGNDTTCTLLGTVAQISTSNLLYNGMLSFYFLLTVRFGYKERQFVNRFERWMHVLCIGYPTITAFTGLGMGVYHEVELGPGCWVNDWPDGCGSGEEDTGSCKSPMIAWIFSGIWVIFTILAIIINNMVIYCFVRRQLRRASRRSLNRSNQTERIRVVAVQSFLYVAAYLGTYTWTVVLRVMESRSYDAEDEADLYPILILQAIAAPSTGFFNLCIYIRPRYLHVRKNYPNENRYWAIRRALYGETIVENMRSATVNTSIRSAGSGIFMSSREKMMNIMKKFRSSEGNVNNVSGQVNENRMEEPQANKQVQNQQQEQTIAKELEKDNNENENRLCNALSSSVVEHIDAQNGVDEVADCTMEDCTMVDSTTGSDQPKIALSSNRIEC